MTDYERKILTQFCKEASYKKFASYKDEGSALNMYQRAATILNGGVVEKNLTLLINRITAYRKTHGREIYVHAI